MRKNSLIPFTKSNKSKKSKDGDIIAHGKLDKLDFEIYKRGTIHISDKNFTFRKNIDAFDEEIEVIETMTSSEWRKKKTHRINGAGDTDNLIFTYNESNDDLDVSLKKKTHGTIERLKKILADAKVKVVS